MNPIEIGHGWRTRVREGLGAFVTFGGGVVAATAGAAVIPRVIGAVVFVLGTYWLLDALVLNASWRLTGGGLKIPTIASRRREIAGDADLAVSAGGRWVGTVAVAGERGTRYLTVNPLVSPADLRAWFAEIADQPEGH